jgi:RimJ/RimL family protein N-acetyltransferase
MIPPHFQEDLRPLTTLPPRRFETERLFLRALELSDAQLIFDLYAGSVEATKYMSWKRSERPEDLSAWLEGAVLYAEGLPSSLKDLVWVLQLKNDHTPIGAASFGPSNHYTLRGGYSLSPRFWGHGYATEAWCCLLNWAKSQPGVYRIEATHDVENPASGKVMTKAGMSFEGILRRHGITPNISETEPRDIAMYAWARP